MAVRMALELAINGARDATAFGLTPTNGNKVFNQRGRTMKRALGYCRVSGRSQKDGTSLDEQSAQIHAWAAVHEFEVVEFYRDVVSGEKHWHDRPQALALIERLARNGIDAVIVHQLDRVGRGKSAVFEEFLSACTDVGVSVISVVDGKLTPDSDLDEFQQADHDMILSIKMALVRQEKRKLVARMKLGKLRAAKAGKHVNGVYQYGDDPSRPEESAILARMRELQAAGESCRGIARQFNDAGLKPRQAALWSAWAVSKIVKRH
jgi:DNA invertase Pin-like site-specific DNA recombinase